MIFPRAYPEVGRLRGEIRIAHRRDESSCVRALLPLAKFSNDARQWVDECARGLVARVREGRHRGAGIDAFMREYALSSEEGVVLMCLAEALLRIPDSETANLLIRDKLAATDWTKHLGHSDSILVNASTWGLMLTGRLVSLNRASASDVGATLGRLVSRSGEPIIRQALVHAMRVVGRQFVMGRTISEALERAADSEAAGYRHSYDMLGEAACTSADAEHYYSAYLDAIQALDNTTGSAAEGLDTNEQPSISVKLSALHPRYEFSQRTQVVAELAPRLLDLARRAKTSGIGLTVDAEEADRLELQLDVFETVLRDSSLSAWNGLGIAVQAYQKRALGAIEWLAELARKNGRQIPLRLVKGAYWDSEIKRAQVSGLVGYPVFTRKVLTDVSYIACARRIFFHGEVFFPQFATHNAHTVAAVMALAGDGCEFEFQRLHGMGEALYDEVVGQKNFGVPCRVYAPVGSHEELLSYLVRRLLENGANTSFVNRIENDRLPIESVVADPATLAGRLSSLPHPGIPLPPDMYGPDRRNAKGLDLADEAELVALAKSMISALSSLRHAVPLVGGAEVSVGVPRSVLDPANNDRSIGQVVEATESAVDEALFSAKQAASDWAAAPASARADCLDRMANALEARMAEAIAICVREAGKPVADSVEEVREAVDYCRYYARHARDEFADAKTLPGPTGEYNRISQHGRGVFVCVSPWNFPLAIFVGQITAALAAGNTVIAKPAEQTPLMASFAVRLLHESGVPGEVLHFLPGGGEEIGARLISDARIDGVAFTGSTDTAWIINRALAARSGPILPLIAETGGQNAMIVDSSALVEQVVGDVVSSAFGSAGQRCSALRVLFLQEDIAPRFLDTLAGAMDELVVGDPALLETDVGPVIDAAAKAALERHIERLAIEARLVRTLHLPPEADAGTFVTPCAFEIESLSWLCGEQFGPILHVIRFRADHLDEVIAAINATGFGLTLGIHSRIEERARYILDRVRVGNAYVNRGMTGAVVGVQPFGGEGLSGTGPKAGGPRYLQRFACERTVSINLTAAGGNVELLSLGE